MERVNQGRAQPQESVESEEIQVEQLLYGFLQALMKEQNDLWKGEEFDRIEQNHRA